MSVHTGENTRRILFFSLFFFSFDTFFIRTERFIIMIIIVRTSRNHAKVSMAAASVVLSRRPRLPGCTRLVRWLHLSAAVTTAASGDGPGEMCPGVYKTINWRAAAKCETESCSVTGSLRRTFLSVLISADNYLFIFFFFSRVDPFFFFFYIFYFNRVSVRRTEKHSHPVYARGRVQFTTYFVPVVNEVRSHKSAVMRTTMSTSLRLLAIAYLITLGKFYRWLVADSTRCNAPVANTGYCTYTRTQNVTNNIHVDNRSGLIKIR